MTQCVVDPDSKAFGLAEKLRAEWVVKIDGKVRRRPEGTTIQNCRPARSKSSSTRSKCWARRAIADAGVRRSGIS
jgi:aspartyl-tRNA synthetase